MKIDSLSNKIIWGNALTELKKLPPNSIQLIFADPPYNIVIKEKQQIYL